MSTRTLGDVHGDHFGAVDPPGSVRLTLADAGGRAVSGKREATDQTSSDQRIVAGLLEGEGWAADALYERVHPTVVRTLRRTLRRQDDELEDLMQESFERMLRVLSERPLSGACNLPGWAAAVSAHVALDRLRRRARERRHHSPEPPTEIDGGGPGLERDLDARERLERVQLTLGRMRPQYAEALLLHDVLGHDLNEVAEMTGTSVSAAQSRLVRGRKDFQRRTGGKARR